MNNVFDRMLNGDNETTPPEPAIAPSPVPEPSRHHSGTSAIDSASSNSKEDAETSAAEMAAGEEAGSTPADVRAVTQELLKYGYIEEAAKQALFQRAVVREREIAAALEPLDLVLRLDTYRGIAFLTVAEAAYSLTDDDGAWTHPLVRRQRLTLEQSLLIAILRQTFVLHEQEAGVGHSPAKVAIDELLPLFLTYFEDSGSDAKNESRLSSLLDQLKTYGIVSEVDRNQEVTIRPLIAHLASPESLAALLQALREQTPSDDS